MRLPQGLFAMALTAALVAAAPLSGQERSVMGGSDALEIEADQGLELAQDNKTIIARGNALARRGQTTLRADVLVAHYRDKASPKAAGAAEAAPGSSTEVWRIEAQGNVRIDTPTEHIVARRGEYNIDEGVAVLVGDNLRLVTQNEVITARDSLEYWERRQQAVARGDAVAVQGDHRLSADVLVADIGPDEKKKTGIVRMRAFDNVVLTSPTEVVRGDVGDYVVKTGIVTLDGSVKISREGNQLNGGYAVVNLNTGISRLLPKAPDGGESQRVRGLFMPESSSRSGR